MNSLISLRITVLTVLCIPFTLSAAVPTSPPPMSGAPNGGYFSLYLSNIINTPCAPNTILKGFDTTPGTNYGKRICVALPITAVKDALSGFDSTTGAPVYMNAWLKSGTSVYYNTAGGNVGIGTATPTAKLDVIGNIKASGNISTPASTVLTSGKIQVLDIVTSGTACTPNGLIARDSVGLILSCQSGVWKSITANSGKQTVSQITSIYANSMTTFRNFPWAGFCSPFQTASGTRYIINTSMQLYLNWGGSYNLSLGNISGGSLSTYDTSIQITPTGLLVTKRGHTALGCPGLYETQLYPWQS